MLTLQATDIVMQFEQRRLFSIDALQFSQGQHIYLQGDNGCGKTTLMKLLAGLIPPSQGRLSVTDNGVQKPPLGHVVYLHQHPYLFEGTVKHNLNFAARLSRDSGKALEQRTDQAIEMAGLSHLISSNAANLSGGERQRLAIARAWILNPKLLLLDEPISNMDLESSHLVQAMVNALAQQGAGLLVSSHQQCGLTEMCQQQWRIENQRLICQPWPCKFPEEKRYVSH
ncbi:ATP-binding cassette domain-containing protein [Shewanella sp. NIFS-20-20]|uniref:ABC transporter ATP-binding protein n=1 Tax=Shewanella sp. NIFS-20-20 TaxID=2853806 RepID=UPI001C48A2B6|nr:energy-coupling factor ABC transporter ATP-binding protein [Shewanella sp. NIFS-20-20]MBV7316042.1 energy-coupling factor ABC transporter ATP-binding protein [Shewanella sp. NIFS-20-20]